MDYNTAFSNITLTQVLLFALFGFVVGFIINAIDSGSVRGGIVGTTLFGIAGALLGGIVSSYLFGVSMLGFSPEGILTGVVGGLLLSFIYRLLFRETGHFKTTTSHLQ